MNNDIIVKVEGLSKSFKVYHSSMDILKEWVTFGRRSYHKNYKAIKDISFNIHRGEFVGIIGQNGAGKSTLLKVITDVLKPSAGTYNINGRVLSILELSGGTDEDLTGRENVIRSGQLLGLPNEYIRERMDVIKEFSELEDFFEKPLRMYSTGMRTRLAFSMFAFMDTELLILDEVLAVGDIFFRQKCFARLGELIDRKTSIVLVTHSMGIIQRYCNRVILLEKGEKIYDGDPGVAIRLYLQLRGEQKAKAIEAQGLDEEGLGLGISTTSLNVPHGSQPDSWPQDSAFKFRSFPKLQGKAILTRLAVLNDNREPTLVFKQGECLHLYCEFQLKRKIEIPVFRMEIRDKRNLLIHSKDSIQNHTELPFSIPKDSIIHYSQSVTLNIAPGDYIINIICSFLSKEDYEQLNRIGYKMTIGRTSRLWKLDQAFAIAVLPRFGEPVELLHGGLCDLPGNEHIQFTTIKKV